jgi:hypothetical protein
MTQDQSIVPFHRSFILAKVIYLDKVKELTSGELDMLNVETLAALQDARHNYDLIENKQSEEASGEYRRIKMAGYFQAAIQIELQNR